MGINDFFGANIKEAATTFKKASEGKTKEEVRMLEQQMLKPEKLKPITIKKPTETELDKRSVLMVFPDKAAFDLFVKHFPIRTCGGNNLADMDEFMDELKLIDQRKRMNEKLKGRLGTTKDSPDVDFIPILKD